MKKAVSLFLALVMILTLGACSGGGAGTSAAPSSAKPASAGTGDKAGKTDFNVAFSDDPGDMSPFGTNSPQTTFIKQNIYDTLFTYKDATNEQVPRIAQSWKADESGKLVTYTLRKGVKDSNGNEIKASDVLYSINLAAASKLWGIFVAGINLKDSKAIDDYTVQLALTDPGASTMAKISKVSIVSKASYEASKDKMVTTPVGSGPYKLVKWVQSSYLTLDYNKNYWKGEPQVKNITFKIISEPSQKTTALVTGEVDYIYDCQISDMDYISKTKGLVSTESPTNTSVGIYMNNSKDNVMNNIDLRKAICYAIDNKAVAKVAYSNHATPAVACESTSCIDFKPEFANSEYYKYSVEKAKEYLKKSGFDTSKTIRIACKASLGQDTIAAVIQGMLKEIGINSKISVYENSVMASLILDKIGDWDIAVSEWMTLSGLGADSLQMIFANRNYPHVDDATKALIKDLTIKSMNNNDAAATKQLYDKVHSDCAIFAICYTTFKYAHASYVKNINYYGAQNLSIEELKFG